jgi:hypothetical protein
MTEAPSLIEALTADLIEARRLRDLAEASAMALEARLRLGEMEAVASLSGIYHVHVQHQQRCYSTKIRRLPC